MCCRTSHPDQPSQASTNQDCAAWVWKSLELFRTYTKNPEVTFGVPNRRDQPATLDQPKPFQTPSLLPLGLPNPYKTQNGIQKGLPSLQLTINKTYFVIELRITLIAKYDFLIIFNNIV